MSVIEDHYIKNYRKIFKRLSYKAGGSHQAEDILQESYLRALQYYDKVQVLEFDKWFSIIINNSYNKYMRDEIGLSYIEDDSEPLGSIDCSLYEGQVLREVYDLVSTKSENQIEILNLHLKGGLTPIDISKITIHTYSSIHKTIQRFKQEIMELYG